MSVEKYADYPAAILGIFMLWRNAGLAGATSPGMTRVIVGLATVLCASTQAQFPPTIDLGAGEGDVIIYGASADDFGTYRGGCVVGDVNGDGIDDLVFGTRYADGPAEGKSDAGEAYVYFGRSTWSSPLDLAGIVGLMPDVTIYGASGDDMLTRLNSIVLADVNGDGTTDLLLGAHRGDGPFETRANAGEAYVIYGGNSLPATIDLANGDEDVIVYGATANDYLTADGALAADDLNNDGIADIILGALGADGPAESRASSGEAYIIYGSSSLPAVIDLNNSDEDVTIYGVALVDQMTSEGAVMTLDLNGDGIADLVLGAAANDGPGGSRSNSGAAYVIYGSNSLPATIDLNNSDEDVTIYGASAGLTRTDGILSGDVNGDGISDLVLCAASEYNGTVYVVYGASNLPSTLDFLTGDYSTRILGASTDDDLTLDRAIAIGDVNGDSIDDMVLGAKGDGPGEGRMSAGEAYVVYGSPSLPSTIRLDSAEEDVTIYGADSGDLMTLNGAVALFDPNADSIQDIALGASYADGPAGSVLNGGEAYIIPGSASIPAVIDLNAGTPGTTVYGASASDWLTYGPIASGDLNGDGADEIILCAAAADGPGEARSNSGEIYILFGTDTTYPVVQAIQVADGDSAWVDFTVTFSEPVTGVGPEDFMTDVIGIMGVVITGVSGSGSTYTVSVSYGAGSGSISIDLVDDDSIEDRSANTLGGPSPSDGDFSDGEAWIVPAPPLPAVSLWAMLASVVLFIVIAGIKSAHSSDARV